MKQGDEDEKATRQG